MCLEGGRRLAGRYSVHRPAVECPNGLVGRHIEEEESAPVTPATF